MAVTPPERGSTEVARQILPTSGTMIGVCTTLVGLVKILEGQFGGSHVDEWGAIIAVAFLASAIFSYLAIRVSLQSVVSGRTLERCADVLFLFGLFALVVLVALFAFETI
ncbi:hypothetical protein ACIKT0_05625 [Hansschlegelia beijingensis]|uniref:hypothetical protein n=1 Tax=Hansschlegelia beijingensis TaxID=1133344 RepID=UPI00387F07D6